jgi:hypothetical protein
MFIHWSYLTMTHSPFGNMAMENPGTRMEVLEAGNIIELKSGLSSDPRLITEG